MVAFQAVLAKPKVKLWDDDIQFGNHLSGYLRRVGFLVSYTDDSERFEIDLEDTSKGYEVGLADIVDARAGFDTVGPGMVGRIRKRRQDQTLGLLTSHAKDYRLERSLGGDVVDVGKRVGADFVVDKGTLVTRHDRLPFACQLWNGVIANRLAALLRAKPTLDSVSALEGMLAMSAGAGRYIDVAKVLKAAADTRYGGGVARMSVAAMTPTDPNAENARAFRSEFDALLRSNAGAFVAYAHGSRVALAGSREAVYAAARKIVGRDIILVQQLLPQDNVAVKHLRGPRTGNRMRLA